MATRRQKWYVSTLCLLFACHLSAQEVEPVYNTYSGRKPRHYMTISVGGGEANNFGKHINAPTDTITHLGGAAANVGLHYEVQRCSWIFGIGVEAQYQYLRDRLSPFTEQEDSLRVYTVVEEGWPEPFLDSIAYSYRYANYRESGHHGSVAVSVYGGKEFIDAIYLLLGVKLTIPIQSWYNVAARFSTSARYSWAIDDLSSMGVFSDDELHAYGVFQEDGYNYHNTYKDYLRVAPFFELGYNIPLRAAKTKMRVGVYGSYGFRLGSNPGYKLSDYSRVDKNWGIERTIDPENLDDLQRDNNGDGYIGQSTNMFLRDGVVRDEKGNVIERKKNLTWNPLNHSDRYKSLPHNLEVGVKFTVLFDVTTEKKICNCYFKY